MDTVAWPFPDIQATTDFAKRKNAAEGRRRLQKAAIKAEAWEVQKGNEYDHRPSMIAAMFLAISKITCLGNKMVF